MAQSEGIPLQYWQLAYDDDPDVEVARDQDVVTGLDHVQQPWSPTATAAFEVTAPDVARQYLLKAAPAYGISESLLQDTQAPPVEVTKESDAQSHLVGQRGESDAPPAPVIADTPPALKLAEQRARFKSTAITYQQTLLGLPVWGAKFCVTLNDKLQVVNSVSSVKSDALEPRKPAEDAKFLDDIGEVDLREVLGLRADEGDITINYQGLLVYQYDGKHRQELLHEHGEGGERGYSAPTLILHEAPDNIQEGTYYVVREVLFTLPVSGYGNLNWRAFVEVETGAVLYLRALTSGVSNPVYGWVFPLDPTTKFGPSSPLPSGDIMKLNLLREKVQLPEIIRTTPQALKGTHAEIKEINAPVVLPPTTSTDEFNYSVESDGFAAVSGYYHITTLFDLLRLLGFNISDLFDRTQFPVPVDHRGFDNQPNAQAPGNRLGNGSGGFIFGRADLNPSLKVGISADFRIAAHEFGHALLWDAISSPNFGFAHSAGDAIGAIYSDPGSQAPDRFDTFPWSFVRRSHGRDVTQGWAWGGTQSENRQYPSEQILSTCLFRIYRAIGGDATGDLARQTWASRYTLYLIIGGIFGLVTETRTPDTYVSLLIAADRDTIIGHPGGAVRKIIRWAFEKQGLYQRPGAPRPVVAPGAPPLVDVFIEDTRNGEYNYRAVFNDATGIWNRNAADGDHTNQAPIPGENNHIYVTVKNRGLQQAQNVRVTVYVSNVADAQKWGTTQNDFNTLTTLTMPSIAVNDSAKIGPFTWMPATRLAKHSILASVSADSDLSIIDPGSGLTVSVGPVDLDKLVPFDNNLALRTF
ncbi:hypothetical protein LTR70_001276 [Exophiala xenobiotica]|uniref:CARDB domain-containing protein n=1 Tax=Lithohypha guttulata TaxID=1690604 RepID=A0ABR0KKK6_9EURO|nr:hypothetical protein LTR24_001527 [Lithohypha guttulata]KAK5328251.1 hypothetical protein LTR70_001276 [Exophiala xenobiotica]